MPDATAPAPPAKPANAALQVSSAIGSVMAVPMKGVNLLNEGFASATNFIANALPSFPAATLTSIAMGIPHAHTLHPPSGPPPIPPTPLPPIGPVMFGTSVQVLKFLLVRPTCSSEENALLACLTSRIIANQGARGIKPSVALHWLWKWP